MVSLLDILGETGGGCSAVVVVVAVSEAEALLWGKRGEFRIITLRLNLHANVPPMWVIVRILCMIDFKFVWLAI